MFTLSLYGIAATDPYGALGQANQMLWYAPNDLSRFKRLTIGQPIIMGYATAQSLGRALPGRPNIVLSRNHTTPPFEGQRLVGCVDEAIMCAQQIVEENGDEPMAFVIGGSAVYEAFIPHYAGFFLTQVQETFPHADTYFPSFAFWHRLGITERLHVVSSEDDYALDGAVHTRFTFYSVAPEGLQLRLRNLCRDAIPPVTNPWKALH